MRRSMITAVIALLLAFLFLPIQPPLKTDMHNLMVFSSPTPVASSIVSSRFTSNSENPAIPVALIGAIGVIIAALISAAGVIYQARRNTLSFTRKKSSRRTKKVKRHTRTYRYLLSTDPRITKLQILDMSRPILVTNVYIRLRLKQEARLGYELDPELLAAEAHHDPNALFQASRRLLENQLNTALDPDKAIRAYKHCVIVGDPGAGKTTLLKYLAIKSAKKQLTDLPDLPVHIELNNFASSKHEDLLDYASTKWEELYGIPADKANKYLIDNLEAGKVLLLLDALDETVIGATTEMAEHSYYLVSRAIIAIARRFNKCPIVVTARKAGYQQRVPLTGFTELEVLDFNAQDIWQFVNKWFAGYSNPKKRTNATDLQLRLRRNPRIQALAANPLLLSLIAIVYESQLDLPDRRAELYKQCTETLLTKWDASRDIRRRREFKPEHKRLLLADVAWHFHVLGRRYFPENELLTVIANFLPAVGLQSEKNRLILEEIVAENGLLKEQARGWYGFLHLTLQEYFAAQYIVDQNQLETLLRHRGDPWWEEVILLYAGNTPDASLLLKNLLGLDNGLPIQEDYFYTNLILAGRCLASRPTIRQTHLRNEVTSRLLKLLEKTPYSLTGQHIVDTLYEIRENYIYFQLSNMISNSLIKPNIREYIVITLGRSDEYSFASKMFSLLSEEQIDKDVRIAITSILGKPSTRSLIPSLLSLLSNENIDIEIRLNIPSIFSKLKDNSIVPELISLLSNEQMNWKIRTSIADSLSVLATPSDIPNLLSLLFNQQLHLIVRATIPEIIRKRDKPHATNLLKPLLYNSQIEPFIRGIIASELGRLKEKRLVPDLLQLLYVSQLDPFIRATIASALGNLGDRTIIPRLLELLSDPQLDPLIGWGIADALGDLGDRTIIPRLLELSSDPQLNLLSRSSIINSLGKLGEHSIIPELLSMLSNSQIDSFFKQYVINSMILTNNQLNGIDISKIINEESSDSFVRIEMINTLSKLSDQRIALHFLQLLSNSQIGAEILQEIANALGKLTASQITPDLLPLLSDLHLDTNIRKHIANTIGKLAEDETTVIALASILEKSDIADDIHKTLWQVSRRLGMRVYIIYQPDGKKIEVVKWSENLG